MAHVIDKDSLPDRFPTHLHESVFWEELGRTIATFGLLEDDQRQSSWPVAQTGKRV